MDGLINNAGERQRSSFVEIDYEKIKELISNNFISKFYLTQKFIKHIKQKKIPRSIINIGSIVGDQGFSDLSGYGSTKGALTGFTKCLAVELSEKSLIVELTLLILDLLKLLIIKISKKIKLFKWTIEKTLLKRWGEPKEISNLVIFLLSEKSSYINGQKINIDGGWTTK